MTVVVGVGGGFSVSHALMTSNFETEWNKVDLFSPSVPRAADLNGYIISRRRFITEAIIQIGRRDVSRVF